MLQIPFGLHSDGRIVEIADVERGLACDCCCPGCGEALLAKKGAVNVQHFAHRSGADCATGVETALHMAAKQLVADKRWLRLPPLEVHVSRIDADCGRFDVRATFGQGESWRFDSVELEVAVGDVRPDALGFIASAKHAVEIRVTHAVDAAKQAYLANLKLPSLEVNLAPLIGRVFTFVDLEAAVIESVETKTWLFHPRQAEWEAGLLAGFDAWRTARLAEIARLRAWRPPVPRPSPPPPPRTNKFQQSNEKYGALPESEKWARLERELGVARNKFPGHLRVALREGADAIAVDKELWQGAVFARFVLGSADEPKLNDPVPNEVALGAWLAQRFGAKGANPTGAAQRAAHSYLNYLRACGFLRRQGWSWFVAHDQFDAPPKAQPAPPAARALPVPSFPPPIRWSSTWPDGERLRTWAEELSAAGEGFDVDWFLGWLLSLTEPASFEDARQAFESADGNPRDVESVLRGLGVVTNTWRQFSYGDPAPWFDV